MIYAGTIGISFTTTVNTQLHAAGINHSSDNHTMLNYLSGNPNHPPLPPATWLNPALCVQKCALLGITQRVTASNTLTIIYVTPTTSLIRHNLQTWTWPVGHLISDKERVVDIWHAGEMQYLSSWWVHFWFAKRRHTHTHSDTHVHTHAHMHARTHTHTHSVARLVHQKIQKS